ncbi:MAG: YceI family protein [Bacteroidota bacterium]|jgi:polyisoprenoid-binding protein YceI
MKKFAFLVLALGAFVTTASAQIYKAQSRSVKFYSHTALEDISAVDTTAIMILNTTTNDVIVSMNIKGFDFPNELMEEHFNENYMESEKFPKASFKGKINEKVDYKKDGTYNVTITGTLGMHGVDKARTIPATIVVKGGKITVDCKFMVALKDHNVAVPSAVGAKIAESVEVTVHADMVAAPTKK